MRILEGSRRGRGGARSTKERTSCKGIDAVKEGFDSP
jgi:hypothetical protein